MIRDDIIQRPEEPGRDSFYKIALFQGGLGMNQTFFEVTLDKLGTNLTGGSSDKYIVYDDYIDMTYFNCETNTFEDEDALADFNSIINSIKNDVIDPASPVGLPSDKTVVVRTYLNSVLPSEIREQLSNVFGDETSTPVIDYDSIENQKKKLLYIMNSIKSAIYSEFTTPPANAKFTLVGHSQGGLVNMEATIAQHNDVGRLVSISTPYAPVCIAKIAVRLNEIIKITGNTFFTLMLSGEKEIGFVKGRYYEECVNILASDDYFNNLKARWNSLGGRPDFTVIAGVAGHLINIDKEEWYDLPEIRYNAFDGLVTLQEQTDITHADFVTLAPESMPCYSGGEYNASSCINRDYITYPKCNGCTLPSMGLISALLQSVCDYVEHFFDCLDGSGDLNEYNDFEELPLFKAIFTALNCDSTSEEIDEDFLRYYYLYKDENSHRWISSSDKTIAILSDLLENNT